MIGSFKQLDQKRQAYDEKQTAPKFTHPLFRSPLLPLLGSVLSGVMLALSFPGHGHATAIYAALVPLMFAVHTASQKRAVWLGLLCGFVFFMMSLSWLGTLTGKVDGFGMQVSAVLGYAVLALYCALYFIPFAIAIPLAAKKWAGDNLVQNIRFMFSVTMVFTGFEYLRGLLFTGFPWNPLGVSQYSNVAIIQVATWGGVSVVTAYIVWLNAGIFVTFRQYTHGVRSKKYRPHFELMLGILPVALAVAHGMGELFDKPEPDDGLHVALIQPNIVQQVKWDPEMDQEIRQRLAELTMTATRLDNIDLVIWPETALPDYWRPRARSRVSYDVVRELAEEGVPILVGSMDFEQIDGKRTLFNSAILVGTDGAIIGKYDKQHLVPFGEYVPFPGLMRKFTPIELDFGHGTESTLLTAKGMPHFSVLICFEDIVAPLSVNAVQAGARWLVNQTNDGWFDPSAQSEQHLAHAVFRCIENRVPMARCCNTGVTATIDAYGAVQRKLDPRTKGFTIGHINPRYIGQEKTFYTRHGNIFGKGAFGAGILILFALRFKGFKKRVKGE